MRLIGHHIGQCIICSDNSNTYFVAKPGQPFDLAEQRAGLAQAAQLEILEGNFTAYKALKALPHIVHLQQEQYALLERAAETHNSDIFEAMADMLLPQSLSLCFLDWGHRHLFIQLTEQCPLWAVLIIYLLNQFLI